MISAEQAIQRYVAGMQTAASKYKEGVASVTEAPNAAAARAKDRYLQGVQDAVSTGSYERGNMSVSLQDWQQAATTKGATRLASGAQAAVPKLRQVVPQLLAHIAAGKQALPPRGDAAANDARMIQMVNHMRTFRRS